MYILANMNRMWTKHPQSCGCMWGVNGFGMRRGFEADGCAVYI